MISSYLLFIHFLWKIKFKGYILHFVLLISRAIESLSVKTTIKDTLRWRFATRWSISRQLTRMVPLRTLAPVEIAKFKVPSRDSNPPALTFPFPRVGIPFFRRFRPRFSSSSRRGGMESTISPCVVSSPDFRLSFLATKPFCEEPPSVLRLLLLIQSTPPPGVLVFVRVNRFLPVI